MTGQMRLNDTRRRWSMHFMKHVLLVPRRSRREEAELVLCQRMSPIKNMASVETNSSSTELEVRYATKCRNYYICYGVCEINFV